VSKWTRIFGGTLADENALLRASMTDLRERLSEAERMADSDALTPLPNRRLFLRELDKAVTHANRHGTQAAVLYLDVKNVKGINSRHGHFAGDAALVHVARLIDRLIRSTDTAARLGGDEFGIILDHLDHNSAIETSERIAQCIAKTPLEIDGVRVRIKVTVGVAQIMPGDTVDEVLQRADRNLHRARDNA
jgi:diguanylate cyclase (GGDEF)-like protein